MRDYFSGLDIAPSQLEPGILPTEVLDRISYVRHNFLERLPFPDDSFDFVRLASVSLGVPGELLRWEMCPRRDAELSYSEYSWLALVDEAVRVLRPGCEKAHGQYREAQD